MFLLRKGPVQRHISELIEAERKRTITRGIQTHNLSIMRITTVLLVLP